MGEGVGVCMASARSICFELKLHLKENGYSNYIVTY